MLLGATQIRILGASPPRSNYMKTFLSLFATVAIAIGAQGQTTFVFGNLNGGGQAAIDLDEKASGSTTMGGLTLTAAANTGIFNSAATTGFGINAAAAGDSTTEFDTYTGGADSMTFSFSMPVTINTIDLNAFGAGDTGFFTYSGGTIPIATDPFPFVQTITLAANEQAMFGATTGSFGLQSITVTVVPEPSTYAMMGLGAALLVGVQRFRRKTS